ncbi:uncharacterized protein Z518_06126 [Rhinocladiella mackenziei CBS 650.93]|uniref:Rhinocladiella mackenziei CBS 650.93 unplaced genomic scaffold supercont1.4, whole genome shotgun sequence n=1 Tax=Rhinocladiella mackenziei CBS 650.93 TaxID=1442369 RepID=A0A0D2IHI6_9EURO|nr:uncharacterized protein Z518_06126 [Rhinocladiella mackenziei CBS 650.93]KIX05254.1 hypothetical protein Z518_06126 [Rhinocladiella mackenziei CBS 650.93]
MLVAAKVECHCRLTSFPLSIPSSSLPLKSAVCNCNSCRHATGQLFATFAVIPVPLPTDVLQSDGLVRYDSSSTCQRWFCKKCGASIINIDRGDGADEWEVATGVLHFQDEKGLEDQLNRVQLWVEDVKADGGATGWINQGKLAGMDRHWQGRKSGLVSDEIVAKVMGGDYDELQKRPSETQLDDMGLLQAHCHCRKVSISIARPERGFNEGTGKFGASLDACTSCRLVSGFEVTSWITIPRGLIHAGSQDLEYLLADRSRLGHYNTSSDVDRYFCVNCGATVFYYKDGLDTIDMGAGLLSPTTKERARVEDWLRWERYPKGVFCAEDAIDKGFVGNIMEGMRLVQERRE